MYILNAVVIGFPGRGLREKKEEEGVSAASHRLEGAASPSYNKVIGGPVDARPLSWDLSKSFIAALEDSDKSDSLILFTVFEDFFRRPLCLSTESLYNVPRKEDNSE